MQITSKLQMKRICIIGAGPSGLITLKVLQESKLSLELVCYESQKQIGGLWFWEGDNYVSEDGCEVHSSMYEGLKTNGPKEAIEFTDYGFPDSLATSFPNRMDILTYIEGYAEKFNLHKYINLRKRVTNVSYLPTKQSFKIVVQNASTLTRITEEYDYVIVCNGHYTKPFQPVYPGEETFPGKIIHSKYFRSADYFVDKRILLVGSSFSATDIALLCYKTGVKSVTLTSIKPIGLQLPSSIAKRPIICKIEGRRVFFKDNTSDEFDLIVYCTGYQYSFPFLDEDLLFYSHDRFATPLYLWTVFPDNPSLFFVGMQSAIYTFTMFYHQARLIRFILERRFNLPPKDAMLEHIKEWQEKENLLESMLEKIEFQTAQMDLLIQLTNSDARYSMLAHFKKVRHCKIDNFEGFTDVKFDKVF